MTQAHITAWTVTPPPAVSALLTILEPALGTAAPSFPRPLPPLEHRFRSPSGDCDYPPIVDSFQASEDGGFDTLGGTLEAARVLARPDIYCDGAQWIVTDPDTGDTVAAGDLLTPAIAGGVAAIKAEGWAKRVARSPERLMYQARGYGSVFVPKHTEPFGLSGHGYLVQSDNFEVSTDGALRWSMKKAASGTYTPGDNDGVVAFFGGLRGGVRRIAGTVECSQAGAAFELRTVCGDSPAAALPTPTVVHDFSGGGATSVDFDVAIPIPGPVLVVDVARSPGSPSSLANDTTVTVTDLRVNGIAVGDTYTGAQVAVDVAGRTGLAVVTSGSPYNVLPLDAGAGGAYADALDLAALLEGSDWRVTATRRGNPLLEWFTQGGRVWEVIDPEFPVDPVPLPQYDSVLVPYLLSNGVATDVLEVTGVFRLPVSRAYGPIELPDPLPVATTAQQIGELVLRAVSKPLLAGRVQFSRVLDEDSRVTTCHSVHTGDSLYLPNSGGFVVPIKGLTRAGDGVTAELDDGPIPALSRYLARRAQGAAIRYPK